MLSSCLEIVSGYNVLIHRLPYLMDSSDAIGAGQELALSGLDFAIESLQSYVRSHHRCIERLLDESNAICQTVSPTPNNLAGLVMLTADQKKSHDEVDSNLELPK